VGDIARDLPNLKLQTIQANILLYILCIIYTAEGCALTAKIRQFCKNHLAKRKARATAFHKAARADHFLVVRSGGLHYRLLHNLL